MRKFVVIVLLLPLLGCFMPEAIIESQNAAQRMQNERALDAASAEHVGARIHYMARPSEGPSLVVFIHGTPGDWTVFSPQMASEVLHQRASMLTIDRPGWGQSIIKSELIGISLAEQSQLIGPVLQDLKNQFNSEKLILVGHSLGASLVPKLSLDFPESVDAVVAIAGDLTDDYPTARWYNSMASWRAISWMLPEKIKRANDEVLALESNLRSMKSQWLNLRVPFLVLQGEKDSLVDPRHANFAASLATQSQVKVMRFADGDHLMHLKNPKIINHLIAEFIDGENL